MSLTLDKPAADSRQRFSSAWLIGHIDVLYVVVLVVVSGLLRFWDLSSLPHGLHGDEAATGLDARLILEKGSIGPYTPSALGQPAGPMYVAAAFVKLFGNEIFSVRAPMATMGIATVVLSFFMLRLAYGRVAAYAGSALLALSAWLIFFNRTGYTVSAFPLTEAAALLALLWALKTADPRAFGLAGAVLGAGIYGYFAYPLFAVALALWATPVVLLTLKKPPQVRLLCLALYGTVALIAILPMRPYLVHEDHGYIHDRQSFSIFERPEYKAETSAAGKLSVIVDNGERTLARLFLEKRGDGSDGSGAWPALDPIIIALALAGLGAALYRYGRSRDPVYLLPPLLFGLVFLGPLLSYDGTNRRSLGLLLPVVMLAAIAAREAWEAAPHFRGGGVIVRAMLVGLLVVYGFVNYDRYYNQIPGSEAALFAFGPQLTDSVDYMRAQPDGTLIYFASVRWPPGYETVAFLAPGLNIKQWNGSDPMAIPPSTPVVFVLIDEYMSRVNQIKAQFPQATLYTGPLVHKRPGFLALEIPTAR